MACLCCRMIVVSAIEKLKSACGEEEKRGKDCHRVCRETRSEIRDAQDGYSSWMLKRVYTGVNPREGPGILCKHHASKATVTMVRQPTTTWRFLQTAGGQPLLACTRFLHTWAATKVFFLTAPTAGMRGKCITATAFQCHASSMALHCLCTVRPKIKRPQTAPFTMSMSFASPIEPRNRVVVRIRSTVHEYTIHGGPRKGCPTPSILTEQPKNDITQCEQMWVVR